MVIAHPDDESMFFTPTLTALRRRGQRAAVLCLSSGASTKPACQAVGPVLFGCGALFFASSTQYRVWIAAADARSSPAFLCCAHAFGCDWVAVQASPRWRMQAGSFRRPDRAWCVPRSAHTLLDEVDRRIEAGFAPLSVDGHVRRMVLAAR